MFGSSSDALVRWRHGPIRTVTGHHHRATGSRSFSRRTLPPMCMQFVANSTVYVGGAIGALQVLVFAPGGETAA